MPKASKPPYRVFLAGTLAAYASLVAFSFDRLFGRDWEQFSSFSLFARSAILHYKTLPIYDPWFCGGLNFLANPQNRLFSPSILLDLALPPLWANLASLMIYGFLGQVGMFRFLEHLRIARSWAIAGAILFVNANWFGMHYAEGHIPYGTMQLLPWVLLATLRIGERGSLLLLSALMALFLLDGSIYTFVFSIYAMATLFALRPKEIGRELAGVIRKDPCFASLCAAAFALLSAPKVIPLLVDLHSRPPELDHAAIPPLLLLRSFFFPFNQVGGSSFMAGFHEIGCYIGIPAAVLLIQAFRHQRLSWKEDKAWLLMAAFWFWTATGWLDPVNPWRLLQLLPFLNQAHLQTRTLILFYLPLLILLAKALSRGRLKLEARNPLILLLLIEALVVRNYSGFVAASESKERRIGNQLIESTEVARTVSGSEIYRSPWHYLNRPYGTKACYEPSIRHLRIPVRTTHDSDYKGEIWVQGPGLARWVSAAPNRLEIQIEGMSPGSSVIHLNQRAWPHWRTIEGGAAVTSMDPEETLTILPSTSAGRIALGFSPNYLKWMILAWVLGIILTAVLAAKAF